MNEHDRAEFRRLARKLRDTIESVRRENDTGAGVKSMNVVRAITCMEQAEGLILEEVV